MGGRLKRTNELFIRELKNIQKDLTPIQEYIDSQTPILIRDKDNIVYKSRPNDLLKGKIPTIQSAIDKRKAFEIKSQKVHNYKYDYSLVEYINARTKVKIICPLHGIFEVIPDSHINKIHNCIICGKEKSNYTRNLNNSGNGWNKTSWKNCAENSKKFSGYKLYIIKCYDNNEIFFKIGRTFRKIKERFEDKNSMPYKWECLLLYEDTHNYIYNIERFLYKLKKDNSYIPIHSFNGKKECYSNIDLNEIRNLIGLFKLTY